MEIDVDRYLDRIGLSHAPSVDRDGLERLMRAHLASVPFDNLDVYAGRAVSVDPFESIAKIVERRRGGWCFELNGAFAELLGALGFPVMRLGAAVLLGGPTKLVDHLCLEVMLDQPYLVDVGFGDSYCRPLELNTGGPQDGGTAPFEFIASAEGTTLTRHDEEGVPVAQYRFRRVALTMDDFASASDRLAGDLDNHWHQRPFATRYLDGGPGRVTLIANELKVDRPGDRSITPVSDVEWNAVFAEWFAPSVPAEPVAPGQVVPDD
ncbi:MAG: arylamine N-acetyltransferase [Actinomycetota bacterium]